MVRLRYWWLCFQAWCCSTLPWHRWVTLFFFGHRDVVQCTWCRREWVLHYDPPAVMPWTPENRRFLEENPESAP